MVCFSSIFRLGFFSFLLIPIVTNLFLPVLRPRKFKRCRAQHGWPTGDCFLGCPLQSLMETKSNITLVLDHGQWVTTWTPVSLILDAADNTRAALKFTFTFIHTVALILKIDIWSLLATSFFLFKLTSKYGLTYIMQFSQSYVYYFDGYKHGWVTCSVKLSRTQWRRSWEPIQHRRLSRLHLTPRWISEVAHKTFAQKPALD